MTSTRKTVREARALQALLFHLDKAQLAAVMGNEITRHLTRYWAAVRHRDGHERRLEALKDAVAATRQEYRSLKRSLESFTPLAKKVERAADRFMPIEKGHVGRTVEEAMRGLKPGNYRLSFKDGKWHATSAQRGGR